MLCWTRAPFRRHVVVVVSLTEDGIFYDVARSRGRRKIDCAARRTKLASRGVPWTAARPMNIASPCTNPSRARTTGECDSREPIKNEQNYDILFLWDRRSVVGRVTYFMHYARGVCAHRAVMCEIRWWNVHDTYALTKRTTKVIVLSEHVEETFVFLRLGLGLLVQSMMN